MCASACNRVSLSCMVFASRWKYLGNSFAYESFNLNLDCRLFATIHSLYVGCINLWRTWMILFFLLIQRSFWHQCRFVELLWQLSLHALREVHRRTFAADVASNPLPASLTDVAFQHAATLLPVTKVFLIVLPLLIYLCKKLSKHGSF